MRMQLSVIFAAILTQLATSIDALYVNGISLPPSTRVSLASGCAAFESMFNKVGSAEKDRGNSWCRGPYCSN